MPVSMKSVLFSLLYFMITLYPGTALPQGENVDLQRGIAEFRQENYEEALDLFLKAQSAEPYSALTEYYLGMTYKNLEHYAEARKHLRLASVMQPPINEALLELAEVNYQMGLYPEALTVLGKAEQNNVRPGQTAFMKGLVLMKMGRNDEAIASFTRARDLSPELVQAAEYQMGLALLNKGELEKGQERFSEVIEKEPDTDMAAYAKNYVDRIEKKKRDQVPYRYYLGFHFQYDDNVVLRPEDDAAASNISDEEDAREVYTAGIDYFPDLKGPFDFSAYYYFYLSNHHDLSNYDVQSHNLGIFPAYRICERSSLGVALGYGYTFADDDSYLAAGSVSPTYTHMYGDNKVVQTYASYQRKEFLDDPINIDEDRDADNYSLNVSWFYFFDQTTGSLIPFMESFRLSSFPQNRGYFNLIGRIATEDTEGQNWDYEGGDLTANIVVPLHDRVKLHLSGDIGHRDYQNEHTVFEKKRRDEIYGLTLLLYYRFYKNLNLQFLYAHRRDDSNIALYDYDRNIYSIGVEYRF